MQNCNNCSGGGECDNCASSCETGDDGVATKQKRLNLKAVLAYRFDPFVHRLIDVYDLSEKEARQDFEDVKRYLYLCVVTGRSLSPPPRIDRIWHIFLVFTEGYLRFCKLCFGKFIHHRPRLRGEQQDNNHSPRMTIRAARARFRKLSKNWRIPHRFPRNAHKCCT